MGARTRLIVLGASSAVVALVLSCTAAVPAARGVPVGGAAGGGVVAYEPPVAEPPVDVFRPPVTPFGPGNRGVDYHTPVDAPVTASAAGRVVFAGPVGAALHVTVLHPDGLRTSYSFLASVAVRVGQEVEGGEVVGTSSGHLHLGVRAGATYLDPLALFAAGPPDVHLVADPVDGATGAHVEGLALLGVVVEAATGRPGRLAPHYLWAVDPVRRTRRAAQRTVGALLHREPCTAPGEAVEVPPERRLLVLVGGFGSTSDSASVDRVDAGALGYAEADVLRFSYAGGRSPRPRPEGALAAIPARPYDRRHSQGDLLEAARRLRELLAAVAAARPGVPIDVIAHSQGGVVARLALGDLAAGPPVPDELDAVATLASPHRGTDVATAIAAVHGSRHGPRLLAALEARLGTGLDPSSAAVAQLAETSELVERLGREPVPPGVRVLAVGARGDLTVPAGHTGWGPGPHPIVDLVGPDAHTRITSDPQVTRELALFLSGRPPTCEGPLDHLTDAALSEAISWAEDWLGAAAWASASAP